MNKNTLFYALSNHWTLLFVHIILANFKVTFSLTGIPTTQCHVGRSHTPQTMNMTYTHNG